MNASFVVTSLLVTPIVTLVGHFGKCPIRKRRSPELVRGVPTAALVCRREDPQQVEDSRRRCVFQQSLERVGAETGRGRNFDRVAKLW